MLPICLSVSLVASCPSQVTPAEELDDRFNDDMKRMAYHKDKIAQAEELRRESELALQKPKNVHKFLDDALASREVYLPTYICIYMYIIYLYVYLSINKSINLCVC
jgi:hypothetical protein